MPQIRGGATSTELIQLADWCVEKMRYLDTLRSVPGRQRPGRPIVRELQNRLVEMGILHLAKLCRERRCGSAMGGMLLLEDMEKRLRALATTNGD